MTYKIILAFLIFIIHFFNTCAQTSALCLILENSINDDLVYKNFMIYNFGGIISIFYSYMTSYPFNDLKYYFIINSTILFFILIIAIYFFEESPRLLYEYSEWIPFTKFFDKITLNRKDSIKNLYNDEEIFNDYLILEKKELENRIKGVKEYIYNSPRRNSIYKMMKFNLIHIKKTVKKGNDVIITRSEVKKNPCILLTFILYDKRLIENSPIIWAYLIIAFLTYNFYIINLYSKFLFNRMALFSSNYVNSSFFHVSIIFIVSNFFNYLLLIIFGFKFILLFCFIAFIIFSAINEIPLLNVPDQLNDLNRYNYGMLNTFYTDRFGNSLRTNFYVLGIFCQGIYFLSYLYIFKFTKTIYRATFFSYIDIINKTTLLVSTFINVYIARGVLIAGILSFFGLLTMIFLTHGNGDFNVITDKKQTLFEKYDSKND